MRRITGIILILFMSSTGHAGEYSNVIFIGNSITLTGTRETGFGLAASSAEKDYVHRLLSMIASRQGHTPEHLAYNVSNFEENFFKLDVPEYFSFTDGFNPDLIVIELGDNVIADSALKYDFQSHYRNVFIELARKHPGADMIAVTKFWNLVTIDTMIVNAVQLLQEAGYPVRCADISSLSDVPENHAMSERHFESYGDGAHPGDRGMLRIAEIIFSAVYGDSTDVTERNRINIAESGSVRVFPNPFNGSAVIEFTAGKNHHAQLIIYDILGREIKILFDEVALRGSTYRVNLNARNLPSGQYFCVLKFGHSFLEKRISIIR